MNSKIEPGSITAGTGISGAGCLKKKNHLGKFNNIILATTIFICTLMGTSPAIAADTPPDIKESPNGEVAIIANLEVKFGSEEDFEKASQLSIKCTRLEPGNVDFAIYKIAGGTGSNYIMYEVWRNKAALQSHFVQPYTQALFGKFKQDLSAPPAMKFVVDLAPLPRPKHAKVDPKTSSDCL